MTTRGSPTPGGRFITIEGPEGGGKTHQAAALRLRLARSGFDVILTREPGGTALGERIRQVVLASELSGASVRAPAPWTDALLFTAARAQLVAEVIRPALPRGQIVICTRFADLTLAYQGYGEGLPIDELRVLQSMATDGLVPDLTILLDLPAELGLARKSGQEETRFEASFDLAFHRRVRDGFLELAHAEPGRFAVIDATQSRDEVFDAVVEVVSARLPELGAVVRPAVGADAPGEPERGSVRSTR